MRIAAINSSYYGMKKGDRIYNLAVERIENYHLLRGDRVYAGEFLSYIPDFADHKGEADKYYFSVIFTWDIPGMIQAVRQVLSRGAEVEIGGPAATFMNRYIAKHTGINPHIGLDMRFENFPGEYKMTFTSRGCPHGCKFCGVRRVEPQAVEYSCYPITPMVGDNNILATSWEHQEQFVKEYLSWGYAAKNGYNRVDINSGFDVRFFQREHYQLYSQLQIQTWRFAFDSMAVVDDVFRVCRMLQEYGLDRHKVTFYNLIGFPGTTPAEARYRMDTVIQLGMNPYPMRFIPLNSLKHRYVGPGWTEADLFKMQTYYQTPFLWMADNYENFRPGKNKQIIKARKMNPNHEQGELIK